MGIDLLFPRYDRTFGIRFRICFKPAAVNLDRTQAWIRAQNPLHQPDKADLVICNCRCSGSPIRRR